MTSSPDKPVSGRARYPSSLAGACSETLGNSISVPARGGYGLPSLYFLLQGALVAAGLRGRVATMLVLIVPLPILFHPWFVKAIVIPLLQ